MVALVVGAAVVLPFALGASLPGRSDLGFHSTLIESQFRSWQELGRPSPFLAPLAGDERFMLIPVVYGGTAYALGGLLRFLLPLEATVLVVLGGAYAAICWGVYRSARSARVSVPSALAIAVAVVACGQSVSTLYARMAVAEVVAFGAAAALVGATATLWTRGRERFGCVPIALTSSAVFFGGHPLTLVWGLVMAAATAIVVVVGLGIRPWRSSGWRWLLPAAAGAIATAWQRPAALHVFTSVRAPSAHQYLDNRYFFEPFGLGSGPSPLRLLDPLRRAPGSGALDPYRTTLPALLIAVICWLLWSTRGDASMARRRGTTAALLLGAAGIAVLPLSERAVGLLWPLATMQYHWRLYSYAVVAIAVAAIVLTAGLGGTTARRAALVLGVVAVVELGFATVQAVRTATESGPVTAGDIGALVRLTPNPVLRNDPTLLRAEDLPVLEDDLPAATVVRSDPDDPEAPLVVRPPEDADRFVVPSIAAPPFVELSAGFRAVGWAPGPVGADAEADRQQWLVVDGDAGSGDLTIRLTDELTLRFAQGAGGPLTVLLLLGIGATSVWAVVLRVRNRRDGIGEVAPVST